MSVCVETSTTALIQPVVSSLSTSTNISEVVVSASTSQPAVSAIGLAVETGGSELKSDHQFTGKSIAKLVVASQQHVVPTSQVLQKVVSSPLITVLNSTGPLTVVKSICVTSVVSSAPQYTLVNTTAPLTVGNAVGKPATITVLNCGPLASPVTVVKTIAAQPVIDKSTTDIVPAVIAHNATGTPALIENRGHNVFVKNTSTCPAPDTTVVDSVLQSHKLLTATNFSNSNVLNNIPGSGKPPPANGQRNKLKILSNVQLTGANQSNNALVNKARYNVAPRPKLIGVNNMSMKLMQKAPNNVIKPAVNPSLKSPTEKSPKAIQPPPQKGPIKNLPPSTFLPKPQQGIKTLSPQQKNIPGQVQRTTSGLRTIPPQRPQKVPTKTNYIGKHAVQAQKVNKPPAHGKVKSLRSPPGNMYYQQAPIHEKQMTFNQALTAQIIETLSNTSTPPPSTKYEWLPSRYDNAFHCPDKQVPETLKVEDKAKSGLDALSLICQAVLLDHNYNATLPPESPPRSTPPINTQAQVNGIPNVNIYSNMQAKRRIVPPPNSLPTPSHSSVVLGPTTNSSLLSSHLGNQDDDAASDVSDGSDRKHDTEGEETDTAPEAEEVKNDDHYGDYVTRCICGFLHDDGYMVECDKCKVWQHVQCVVKNRQIPDEYLCDMCDPSKPVDRQKARLIQQQWIRERQVVEPKIRKEAKLKDTLRQKDHMSDSDSSDGERTIRNNNVTTKRATSGLRRKSESSKNPKKDLKEPVVKRQKRKEKKVVKRKPKPQVKPPPQSHSDDENQDTWSAHLPQLRQWIEKYEEAVTNHYSPELRARISSIRVNGTHVDSNITYDSTVCKCRIHTQPLTEIKYLVSTVQLAANTPIIELRGKYMLSTQHRNSGGSLTTRQHTQKPGPFLFFYRLHKDNTEVCVDTRTYGNSARFIRRSCKPNAELRHCIEKGVLHLYIVSISAVEKNCELTIKHESHDLAAVGTTQIACACGRPDECTVNKTTIKKNGDSTEPTRKRRGRRTVSSSGPPPSLKSPVKESAVSILNETAETTTLPPPPPVSPPPPEPPKEEVKEEKLEVIETEEVKVEIKEEPVEEKVEEKVEVAPVVEPPEEKKEKEEATTVKEEPCRTPSPPPVKVEKVEVKKEKPAKEERAKSPPLTPISTRRSSHQRSSDKEESGKESEVKTEPTAKSSKKLSREERKLEAILRAIEQMEKADQKKQEHQAKQAHRRESEPGPTPKEEEKIEPVVKMKRRRRRGRARTTSTNAQTRRSRLNSTDSYLTSGDENLMSPNEASSSKEAKAAGLLMALHNGDSEDKKSPQRDHDSNSNSAFSSPETPQLSSACLLVQAAVEPLESGFKFPKTKKGNTDLCRMMNEWLNKAPDTAQSGSATSPSIFLPNLNQMVEDGAIPGSAGKTLSALAQVATFCDSPNQQRGGNAKKRWLRQAISEDHSSDGPPVGRPDSPTINDTVAPPKKRKLPRESLSNDNSPPGTPTSTGAAKSIDTPRTSQEGSVEIVYSGAEGDSPSHILESDTELKERAVKMQQEYGKTVSLSSNEPTPVEFASFMDPRLARDRGSFFANSEHLIGTVEKTLSIFGFKKSDCTPAKKKVKLSITEYRQRKKLTSDKTDDGESVENDQQTNEENNSSESFKAEELPSKPRSRSSSSSSSCSSLDNLSSDIVMKAPIFNSEPTELERQREISSLRLKKAFGLPIDEESCKTSVVDITSILNCDMGPKLTSELSMSPTLRAPPTPEDRTYTPVPHPPLNETDLPILEQSVEPLAEMEVEEVPAVETEKKESETQEERDANLFYTPDEEVPEVTEADGVNYVPPFNNPVYPNSNFSSFTSSIDDDSRYQSRNPSPPPDLETPSFGPS